MGENSKIEWTDHTFNPWWGCTKVSPGCANCYAEAFAKRTGHDVWGDDRPRRFFGAKHWNEPVKWNDDAAREGVRRRVFCASMADVFEDWSDLVPERMKLFELIDRTPCLDWLLLTKRPENITRLAGQLYGASGFYDFEGSMPNVWIGTTVENQEMAEKRIPFLMEISASVRFLSCEPLLGPVDLAVESTSVGRLFPWWIDWVICGGESGTRFREIHPDWARSLRDQCREANVPFFFKQWGGILAKRNGKILDGKTHDAIPTANVSGQQRLTEPVTSERNPENE